MMMLVLEILWKSRTLEYKTLGPSFSHDTRPTIPPLFKTEHSYAPVEQEIVKSRNNSHLVLQYYFNVLFIERTLFFLS